MPKIHVTMQDPVVVACSAPGENRWGFHQFPCMSRLPDGSVMLMYADAEDANAPPPELASAFAKTNEPQ